MVAKGRASKAKSGNASKKAASGRPSRGKGTHVDLGVHGLGKILSAVHKAKLSDELDKHLKSKGRFVRISRRTMKGIKGFVNSKNKLSGLAKEMSNCDCPAGDTGCVYWPD